MNVYFISGLAADSRVFKHIRLPEGFDIVHLHWIPHQQKESLRSYSLRLASKINADEPFALVGLSMGGMIATEIARHHSPECTILLSSVPTHQQLPGYFKMAYRLGLHKIVPVQLLKSASIYKRVLAPDTEEDKLVLKQVIRDSDPAFIRWAMQAILSWDNEVIPSGLWQVHGSRDEILPLKFTRPTHIIDKANHLMIMSRAEELNNFISGFLLQCAGKTAV